MGDISSAPNSLYPNTLPNLPTELGDTTTKSTSPRKREIFESNLVSSYRPYDAPHTRILLDGIVHCLRVQGAPSHDLIQKKNRESCKTSEEPRPTQVYSSELSATSRVTYAPHIPTIYDKGSLNADRGHIFRHFLDPMNSYVLSNQSSLKNYMFEGAHDNLSPLSFMNNAVNANDNMAASRPWTVNKFNCISKNGICRIDLQKSTAIKNEDDSEILGRGGTLFGKNDYCNDRDCSKLDTKRQRMC